MGFFGLTTSGDKRPPQPRHFAVVDIGEAFAHGRDIIDAFSAWQQWPDSPPLTGGVLDAWPARLARGLAVCRDELAAVHSYMRHEETQRRG